MSVQIRPSGIDLSIHLFWRSVRHFARDIEAVTYIHSKRVLHCDLRHDNFLLDANLDLKLADFQARRMVASLFYFELDDALPQWRNGRYVFHGYIRCSIRHNDAALVALLRKLSCSHGSFLVGD